MLVKSPTNAGMDAVFRPLSSLGTDGSQFAGSLLAALRRVGSTALACEAVAGWVGHSRVYGSALLVPEPPRLKTLVHHVGPWRALLVGSTALTRASYAKRRCLRAAGALARVLHSLLDT